MGLSIYSEPQIISGNIDSVQNRVPEQAPSLTFQGEGIVDPRFVGSIGSAPTGRPVYGIFTNPYISLVDAVPVALGGANIAALQTLTQGTAMTLASAQTTGISPQIPLIPFGQVNVGTAAQVKVLALDFGYGTVSTISGSTTVTPSNLNMMKILDPGQNVLISGAGASANSVLATTIVSADQGFFSGSTSTTTLTVTGTVRGSPLRVGMLITGGTVSAGTKITALGTGTGGAGTYTINNSQTVAAANLTGSAALLANAAGQTVAAAQIGNGDDDNSTAWPFILAGTAIALTDPTQSISRAVSLTGAASNTGATFLVSGYDIWGQAMSEQIVVGSGVTTPVPGKKAFKYIASIVPTTTSDTTHNYSAGTTDVFGLPLRSDFWEYMDIFMNGAFVTVSTGWTAADPSDAALATTGDVRGTYTVQSASDGTKRLAMFMSLPVYNNINATNLNYKTLFGVTQA